MGTAIKIAGTVPTGTYPKIGQFLKLPAASLLEGWTAKAKNLTYDATTNLVSSWTGQNGGTAVQATVAKQPLFETTAMQGLPDLAFVAGDYLNTSIVLPSGGFYMVAAIKNENLSGATSGFQAIMGAKTSSPSAEIWLCRSITASGDRLCWNGVGGSASDTTKGYVVAFGGYHVVGLYVTATQTILRVDGVAQVTVSNTLTAAQVPTTVLALGNLGVDGTSVGTYQFLGKSSAYGVYSGALTAAQLALIDANMAKMIGNN